MLDIKRRAKTRLVSFIRNNVRFEETYSPPLYGDSYWFAGPNLWEPPVLIALKDLCKPGSVVFDVGGNMGGLTSAMSRLVGPRGAVCTFEASPRIIAYLQQNVVKQGHNNVTVYHRAVFSRSNEIVTIYDGDHLNDSLYAENSPTKAGHPIKTLAIDDFCEASGLVPDVVKMDIEGAEFDALVGAARMIEKHRPHLLLEQQAGDMRCFDFLTQRGYVAIDLNTYKQISSAADYPIGVPLRNVLFVHRDRIQELPYKLPLVTCEVMRLGKEDFARNHMNGYTSSIRIPDPGRYLMDVDFSATGTSNNMMCGVRADGKDVFRYHGYSKLIADSYRDWVVDFPRGAQASIYFDFHDGTSDPSFTLNSVQIRKLEGLTLSLWPDLVVD